MKAITTEFNFEALKSQRPVRVELSKQSFYCFAHMYLSQYMKYPTADFQKEIYSICEDEAIKNAIIVAFRNSAKSTIVTLGYPIWSILGKQQKKFVLIISQTQVQAKMHLVNIKREFETNELLRNDFGPMEETSEEWGAQSLVFPKLGARISAVSSDQSVRGIRHGSHRPDLIIADDVEDMASVKTRSGRNKTYDWFTGDVLPLGDRGTKVIVIGNLLHEDSLLMRLKSGIEEQTFDGLYRRYPIVDESGESLWPGKFPDEASILRLQKETGNNVSWQREYLLNIVADLDAPIKPEWIRYYTTLPNGSRVEHGFGVDLALSTKLTADYTALVGGELQHHYEEPNNYKNYKYDTKIYIYPDSVNERLTHLQTINRMKFLNTKYSGAEFYVEEVGYQGAMTEQLDKEGLRAKGIKIGSLDKRTRLMMVSHLIENGTVRFPNTGCEELIQQILGFGKEKHDDLVDAFTLLVWELSNHPAPPSIRWL